MRRCGCSRRGDHRPDGSQFSRRRRKPWLYGGTERRASTAASKRRLSAESSRASARTRIAQRSRTCRHSHLPHVSEGGNLNSVVDLRSPMRLEYVRSSIRMANFSAVASSRGGCSPRASTAGSWSASRGWRSMEFPRYGGTPELPHLPCACELKRATRDKGSRTLTGRCSLPEIGKLIPRDLRVDTRLDCQRPVAWTYHGDVTIRRRLWLFGDEDSKTIISKFPTLICKPARTLSSKSHGTARPPRSSSAGPKHRHAQRYRTRLSADVRRKNRNTVEVHIFTGRPQPNQRTCVCHGVAVFVASACARKPN